MCNGDVAQKSQRGGRNSLPERAPLISVVCPQAWWAVTAASYVSRLNRMTRDASVRQPNRNLSLIRTG
jgi:hypothetical protein